MYIFNVGNFIDKLEKGAYKIIHARAQRNIDEDHIEEMHKE